MNLRTKLSVIIPAFNAGATLQRAVASLFETGYENLEVVIVDDGSSDATWKVAEELQCKYSPNISRHQHRDAKNLGVSASRNLGIERSTGEYIAFLDADDYVFVHRFDEAIEQLDSDTDIDGVHHTSEIVFSSAAARDSWWDDSTVFGFRERIDADQLLERLLTGKCWATSAVVFRRSLLTKTGTFNTKLSIAEDCNLWFRMAAVGRLVSGDPTNPVSAYWRSVESVYQPQASSRLHMIRAMASFLAWSRESGMSPEKSASARQQVLRYIVRGLAGALDRSDRRAAWSISWQSLSQLPDVALDAGFRRQVARMVVGR